MNHWLELKKTAVALLAISTLGLGVSACSSDADVASDNLSKAADNFEVLRRVVLYNSITDTYVVTVEGYCSLDYGNAPDRVFVTCKVADCDEAKCFKKNIFVKSDNTLVFAEQLKAMNVSTSHYRVIFKPSIVIPDIDAR